MTDQSRLLLVNQQMTALRHMQMAKSALRRMDQTLENLLKLGAISASEYAPLHLDAMRYSRNLKKMVDELTDAVDEMKKSRSGKRQKPITTE